MQKALQTDGLREWTCSVFLMFKQKDVMSTVVALWPIYKKRHGIINLTAQCLMDYLAPDQY